MSFIGRNRFPKDNLQQQVSDAMQQQARESIEALDALVEGYISGKKAGQPIDTGTLEQEARTKTDAAYTKALRKLDEIFHK